jgi:hypothetical protein
MRRCSRRTRSRGAAWAVRISIAFAVFPVAAALVVGASSSFHDEYNWRRYERALDFTLFNIAYPLTFAAMGSIGAAIATHHRKTALSAAVASALNAMVGGLIFSLAITFLPVRGYVEAIAFVAHLHYGRFSVRGGYPRS